MSRELDPTEVARRLGQTELRVPVEVCVGRGGEVTRATVLRSSGFPAYDAKLTREIGRWRYRPRWDAPAGDRTCVEVVFRYRLADDRGPTSGAAPGQVVPS